TRSASRAGAARDDRIEDDLVSRFHVGHAVADRIDDAGAVGAKNCRQWSLGQPASDKHVEVIERHVAQMDTRLAWRGRYLGSFTNLHRRRTVKTYELQSAHVRIMTRQAGWPMMSV